MPISKALKLVAVAVAVAALSGCQTTKPLYNYGAYQDTVYAHFKNEDSSVTQEIDALEKTIAKSAAKNLPVAPGVNAHLGYLYIESGQMDLGVAYLRKEKALYPESAQFIDFLLKNAKAGKS
ncbi:MAG: DUF4810 domain-containing protein [Gammaproteobacteria bacterium]|nr:DUF4810 domain-containing protein [Gammaproteobacteria bacterium]MBU2224099.1 DUF4810 domain-containing protein [Gammaproteobacteria bacterium]